MPPFGRFYAQGCSQPPHAREIAQGPTLAYAHAKQRLAEGWEQPLEEYLREQRRVIVDLAATHDFREGVQAFLERRAPDFRGN